MDSLFRVARWELHVAIALHVTLSSKFLLSPSIGLLSTKPK
jgi:hypothetical protein